MAWFYPDGFFLEAYVKNKLIKLAKYDEAECNGYIMRQYNILIDGLVQAVANEQYFDNDLVNYLTILCNDVDFVCKGAELDLFAEGLAQGIIPSKIISFLVVNRKTEGLYYLLKLIVEQNNIMATKADRTRPMFRYVHGESSLSNTKRQAEITDNNLHNALLDQISLLISKSLHDGAALEEAQVQSVKQQELNAELQMLNSELQTQNADLHQQIITRSTKLEEANAQIFSLEESVRGFIQSTSWRITRPMRVIRRLLHK